jgi:hypothetical protein
MKINAQDKEADPDQAFWALAYVFKDTIYDVASDIEILKTLARSIPEGTRDEDPLGYQLSEILFGIAYAYQKSIRAGGAINGVYLKTLLTQSSSVRYETINRDQKAKGFMEKGSGFLGFGGNKASTTPNPV